MSIKIYCFFEKITALSGYAPYEAVHIIVGTLITQIKLPGAVAIRVIPGQILLNGPRPGWHGMPLTVFLADLPTLATLSIGFPPFVVRNGIIGCILLRFRACNSLGIFPLHCRPGSAIRAAKTTVPRPTRTKSREQIRFLSGLWGLWLFPI